MKFLLKAVSNRTWKLSTTLFLFLVAMQLTTWLPLRFWRIKGEDDFMDSQQILLWSKCYKTIGSSVFSSTGNCSGYMYGKNLLKILSLFSFEPRSTQLLGYAFMFILAILISFQFNHLNYLRNSPIWLLVVLSPPVLLLAERGNFDIAMLSLVFLSASLFSKGHQVSALVPLALASLIKFYTLPLFLIFFILNKRIRLKVITLVVTGVVAFQVLSDLKSIQTSFPSGFSWKFGISIWARYVVQLEYRDPGEIIDNLFGFLALLVIIASVLVFLKKSKFSIASTSVGTSTDRTLTCYLLGMNYDYRLIFILLASVIYLRSLSDQKSQLWKQFLMVLILCLWFTYPSSGLEPIGDLALEVISVILAIRFIQLLQFDLTFKNA